MTGNSEYTQKTTTKGTNFTNIGTTVTFTDRHGRTARIEDTPSGQATKRVEFTYDDADQLIDVARTVGTFFFDTRYEYDNAGRLKDISHFRDDDPTAFTQYLYTYDKANRVANQWTLHDVSIAAFPDESDLRLQGFTYDEAGQLEVSNSTYYGEDESFAYDSNGNREGATAGSSSSVYVTDDYNRLTMTAHIRTCMIKRATAFAARPTTALTRSTPGTTGISPTRLLRRASPRGVVRMPASARLEPYSAGPLRRYVVGGDQA